MNKMFTAVSVLQLAQNGKIKLTAPLGEYLPDYPNKDVASKVTIHHLLTHTGGTGDIFGPQFSAHRLELRTLRDYVKLYGDRDLKFEPGSRWEYSNYGFLLLGEVIEKVTGGSYYAYGFFDHNADGVRSFGHGGGAPGMNGDLRIFPQSGYVIAALSNFDPPAAQRAADFIALRLPTKPRP